MNKLDAAKSDPRVVENPPGVGVRYTCREMPETRNEWLRCQVILVHQRKAVGGADNNRYELVGYGRSWEEAVKACGSKMG